MRRLLEGRRLFQFGCPKVLRIYKISDNCFRVLRENLKQWKIAMLKSLIRILRFSGKRSQMKTALIDCIMHNIWNHLNMYTNMFITFTVTVVTYLCIYKYSMNDNWTFTSSCETLILKWIFCNQFVIKSWHRYEKLDVFIIKWQRN